VSALSAPVTAQSTRDALGGVWATSLTLWAILLVPAIALSAYQTSNDAYPNVLIRAVAVLGPCVTPVVVFVLARLVRRTSTTIPIVLCFAYWLSIGIVHGLTAAWLAVVLTGSQAHYPAQAIFWAVSCLLWMPLVTYGLAQYSDRRRLLTALQSETQQEGEIRRKSLLELADFRTSIVDAIQGNIRPVLVAIAESLAAIGPALDGNRLSAIGRQLAEVSEETARIIETTSQQQPTATVVTPTAPATPLGEALEFERARPYFGAALGCVVLLPLVVAVSFRTATVDTDAIKTEVYIMVVIGALLLVGSVAGRRARGVSRRARIATTLGAYLVAGLAGSAVALVGPWQPLSQQNFLLALMLPIAVPFAASTLSAAVGLGNSNLGIVHRTADVHAEIDEFERGLDQDRQKIREQVSALTHGPLRGRLAACAMALNFHAAEIATSAPKRTEFIIASVREHLDDVLTELDRLG